MAILDTLIGRDQIERLREFSDQAARERYDPDVFNPQVEQARTRAREGIADAPIRRQALQRVLQQGNASQFGPRASAMQSAQSQQKQQQMAEVESQIGLRESQAKRQAQDRLANLRTRQRRQEAKREAQLRQNRAMAEAEAQRRKGKALGQIFKFTSSAVGAATGNPGIGAAIGSGIKSLVQGNEKQSALNAMRDAARPGPGEAPQDEVVDPNIQMPSTDFENEKMQTNQGQTSDNFLDEVFKQGNRAGAFAENATGSQQQQMNAIRDEYQRLVEEGSIDPNQTPFESFLSQFSGIA